MLYLKSPEGKLRIIILESASLEELKKGHPASSPDGEVLICWTPDLAWLADQIMNTDGDEEIIAELIDEAIKRPEKRS